MARRLEMRIALKVAILVAQRRWSSIGLKQNGRGPRRGPGLCSATNSCVDACPTRCLQTVPSARQFLKCLDRRRRCGKLLLAFFDGRITVFPYRPTSVVPQFTCFDQGNFGILAENQPLLLAPESILQPPGFCSLRADEEVKASRIGEFIILVAWLHFSRLNVREHECPHLSISCPQNAPNRCAIWGYREQLTETNDSSESAKNQGFAGI